VDARQNRIACEHSVHALGSLAVWCDPGDLREGALLLLLDAGAPVILIHPGFTADGGQGLAAQVCLNEPQLLEL